MRLAQIPGATVIELGCGLSSRYHRIGNGAGCPWIDLDLPQMIELRTSLGVSGEKHRHIASSVLDRSWFDAIEERDAGRIIIIAEGLLYYLPREEIDRLMVDIRRRFARATMIFDVIGAQDLKPSIEYSTVAGTPILWAVEPPFEKAMAALGLEVIAGFEPEMVMEEMFDRFKHRFGSAFRFIIKNLARIPRLRDHRSGVMIGRLATLPS
jgi:hypothetical protein